MKKSINIYGHWVQHDRGKGSVKIVLDRVDSNLLKTVSDTFYIVSNHQAKKNLHKKNALISKCIHAHALFACVLFSQF